MAGGTARPDVQSWVKAAFEQAVQGKTFRGVSNYFARMARNGSSSSPACPSRTSPVGFSSLCRPASMSRERAQAERDNQATAILESITDGFFAVDRSGGSPMSTARLNDFSAIRLTYFLGKVIWDVFPGLVGSEFARAYHRAASDWVASSVTSYYPDHDRWYEAAHLSIK